MNVRTTIVFSSLALIYLATLPLTPYVAQFLPKALPIVVLAVFAQSVFKTPLPLSTFWVMTTYYGAQYCLTMGLVDVFFEKRERIGRKRLVRPS